MPNAMTRPVFDDLELIEPQQDLYVFVFVQFKSGNDILKFPVVDEQIGHQENLRVAHQGALLGVAELCYHFGSLGALREVIKR